MSNTYQTAAYQQDIELYFHVVSHFFPLNVFLTF